MRSLDGSFRDVQARRQRIENHFCVDVQGRIIWAHREIPAMQVAEFGAALQRPIIALGFRMNHQAQISTHAEIVTVREMQQIGK